MEFDKGRVRWQRGDGHVPVEVVEEAEEVEAELDEALFLVIWKGAEYLCCVVHVVPSTDPEWRWYVSTGRRGRENRGGIGKRMWTYLFTL